MKNCSIAIVFFVAFACQSGNESKVSYLESFLVGIPESENFEHVLVIPAAVSCEYCAIKIFEFLERLDLPRNVLFVLTANSKKELNKVTVPYRIIEGTQMKLDTTNYFFLHQLVFVNPVLYSRNTFGWDSRDIVPVNLNDELKNLFYFGECNKSIIDKVWPLEFSGKIKELHVEADRIRLLLGRFENSVPDTTIFLEEGALDFFKSDLIDEGYIQKQRYSLEYYTVNLVDSMSANTKRHILSCR